MSHQQYASCIQACDRCAVACFHCADACLQESDPKMMARCIKLDGECADICRLASAAMAKGSDYIAQICRLCADICHAGEYVGFAFQR